eukprot:gene13665-biopygen14052
MSEVYASKWKDASGTVRMEDLFTDERLHEDVQDWLSLFQLCALKIQNEAVVEGMGSTMNRHATSVRGLTLDKYVKESFIEYNGPAPSECDGFLSAAHGLHFKGKPWKFHHTDVRNRGKYQPRHVFGCVAVEDVFIWDREAEKGLLMSQRSRDRVGGEGMPVRLDSGGATEVDVGQSTCGGANWGREVLGDREELGEEAWAWLQGLSVGGCAIRDFPSRMVPKRVRGLFTKCVMAALGRMRLDPEDVEAYKLILLLPRLALQPVRVDGSAMQYVKSKEDAQQGDPLGPPYLGAPLQTVLERVQKRHPEMVLEATEKHDRRMQ